MMEGPAVLKETIPEHEPSDSEGGQRSQNLLRNRRITDRITDAMTIIAEIGRLISSSLDIDEVYERFSVEVKKLIPFDRMAICLHDFDADRVTIAYAIGPDIATRKKGDSFPLTGSVSKIVNQKRSGLLIIPASSEELAAQFPSLLNSYRKGMHSIIIAPLISRDVVIGDINFRSTQTKAYTEQHLRLAEQIGMQIAGAIANAKLFADLKKAEKTSQKSELRFRTLFNQASVGVAEIDISTHRFITVNRRLCELVGMTEDELLATDLAELTHPDDRHVHVEGLEELKARKIDEFTMEKRYRKKDGAIIWVSMTLSPLGEPGEESGRYSTVIQDITERKRAEQKSERHAVQLTALHETGLQLMAELNLTDLLNSIAHNAHKLIGGTYCNFFLYRQAEDQMVRVAKAGQEVIIEEMGPNLRPQRGEGIAGCIWETKAPLLIADYHAWPKRIKAHDAFPPRTLIGTPVLWGDELLGVLSLMSFQPHRYIQSDVELLDMFATQAAIAIHNARLYDQMQKNIAAKETAEAILKNTLDQLEARVRERTIELEEINTALQVLLRKGELDTKKVEENIQGNINELVIPFLQRIKTSESDKEKIAYLNILETNLNNIASPFINQLSATYKSLTPKEIQIAELVKQGKSSKEIAQLFSLSVGTIVTHRNNIRKKMHLTSKNANLRSHLLFLS